MMTAVDLAGIGHNQATPFDLSLEEVDGLYTEAKNWLDGKGVNSEAESAAVSKILDAARQAKKTADDARKEEKRPHDEAGAAVQERWRPLIERCDRVANTCKVALKSWLEKVEVERRAVAERARQEADAKLASATEAIRAAPITDLAAREQAETLLRDAKHAETIANRAEKDKAKATGGARAVTLRKSYQPILTDGQAAAKHYWRERRPEMETYLLSLAEIDVRNGKRQIPGFDVIEETSAV